MVDWSNLPAPKAGLRAIVAVPARNEAALLPRALRALCAQGVRDGVAFEVLVLANNCSDDTVMKAREVAASSDGCDVHVVEVSLPPEHANVGTARRMVMDEAAARLERAGALDGVILSTDADTRVDDRWFAANLDALACGADAAGGRILTESDPPLPHGVVHLQRLDAVQLLLRAKLENQIDAYPGDPWPRHHQHFGASIAVKLSAYRKIGGLPRVEVMEDEALFVALRREDLVFRHANAIRVWTSGRLGGRAEVGLAWQLRQWAATVSTRALPLVSHPMTDVALWRERAAARRRWNAQVPRSELATFGRYWESLEPTIRESLPTRAALPLNQCVALLREWVRSRPAG